MLWHHLFIYDLKNHSQLFKTLQCMFNLGIIKTSLYSFLIPNYSKFSEQERLLYGAPEYRTFVF
jgi:hypothetical protein